MGQNATRPRLSVVVPVYNGARTLPDTLRSLQAQTFKDLECIVVDDGSTDKSYDIARAFSEHDPRIRTVRLERNGGFAIAINSGVVLSSGEYVAALAADDYWTPDAAEKFVQALDENPNAAGVYSDWIDWYEREGIKRVHRSQSFSRAALERGDFINFSTLVVRGPIYFDHDWNVVADWDFLLRLTKELPLVYIREMLAVYRIHPAQSSAGLGTARKFFLRLLLPYRYTDFMTATKAALWRLNGAVWHIAHRRRATFI